MEYLSQKKIILKQIGMSVIEKNNTKQKLEYLSQEKIILKKIGISVIEKNNTKKNWNICHRKK